MSVDASGGQVGIRYPTGVDEGRPAVSIPEKRGPFRRTEEDDGDVLANPALRSHGEHGLRAHTVSATHPVKPVEQLQSFPI